MESIRQQIIDAVVNVLAEYDDFSESRAGEIGKYIADELDLDGQLGDFEANLETVLQAGRELIRKRRLGERK